MNLENLKKAALEKSAQALKKVLDGASSNEDNAVQDTDETDDFDMIDTPVFDNDESSDGDEFEEFLDAMADKNISDEDAGDKTQKFNLQDVLDKVRRKSEDLYQSSKEFLSNAMAESKSEAETEDAADTDNDIPEGSPAPAYEETEAAEDKISAELNAVTSEIEQRLSEARAASSELRASMEEFKYIINNNVEKIEEKIIALSYRDQDLDELKNDLKKHINSNSSSTAAINGKMSAVDDKLNEISNSLSGIAKLNDSIFDLKNAQMNSKNSLEELTSAFMILKKKCTAGVTILGIVSALVLIMEVINLLS